MNIIILTYATDTSGGSRQALYLATSLKEAGHRVLFFNPPDSALRALKPDLDWRDLPRGFLKAGAALKAAMEQDLPKTEAVVMHAFHNKTVKLAAFWGTLWRAFPPGGRKIAAAAHRGVIFKPNNPLPYLLPGIRAFIVNSQACADTLPLLWRKKRAHVVYNSLPPGRIIPTLGKAEMRALLGAQDRNARLIGCIANDNPNKGVQVLLNAFAALEQPEAKLVLIGLRESWEERIQATGLADRIECIGPTENVADFLQVFDLLVIPSFAESQPNTMLEAMACGLPVLGSRVGGMTELIAEEAMLFTPGDTAELSSKLAAFLSDPALAAAPSRLAAANLEKSRAFNPDYRRDRVLAIYESILRE